LRGQFLNTNMHVLDPVLFAMVLDETDVIMTVRKTRCTNDDEGCHSELAVVSIIHHQLYSNELFIQLIVFIRFVGRGNDRGALPDHLLRLEARPRRLCQCAVDRAEGHGMICHQRQRQRRPKGPAHQLSRGSGNQPEHWEDGHGRCGDGRESVPLLLLLLRGEIMLFCNFEARQCTILEPFLIAMLLDEMDAIIVIPINPGYQSV
jgi:hypothetical protein